MRHDENPPPNSLGTCLIAIVSVPALYLLSLGPAISLVLRGYMSPDFFNTIYEPLALIYRSFPSIRPAVDWFERLWQ